MRYVWRILMLLVWFLLILAVLAVCGCRTGGTLVVSTTIQGVDVSYVLEQ